jgi:hypothetical protein
LGFAAVEHGVRFRADVARPRDFSTSSQVS